MINQIAKPFINEALHNLNSANSVVQKVEKLYRSRHNPVTHSIFNLGLQCAYTAHTVLRPDVPIHVEDNEIISGGGG
jgi:hypothetical protein